MNSLTKQTAGIVLYFRRPTDREILYLPVTILTLHIWVCTYTHLDWLEPRGRRARLGAIVTGAAPWVCQARGQLVNAQLKTQQQHSQAWPGPLHSMWMGWFHTGGRDLLLLHKMTRELQISTGSVTSQWHKCMHEFNDRGRRLNGGNSLPASPPLRVIAGHFMLELAQAGSSKGSAVWRRSLRSDCRQSHWLNSFILNRALTSVNI